MATSRRGDSGRASTYGRWCRPKMAELLECVGLDAVYVRACGAYLYRDGEDGREAPVLDLAGGFGAGLLGHNNSELRDVVRAQLDAEAPFLAQGAVRREAGELAVRLNAALGLGAPYVCHLTNSGAEAALKHAYKVRFDALRREFERIGRGVENLFRTAERDHPDVAVPSGRDLRAWRDDVDEHNVAEHNVASRAVPADAGRRRVQGLLPRQDHLGAEGHVQSLVPRGLRGPLGDPGRVRRLRRRRAARGDPRRAPCASSWPRASRTGASWSSSSA